MSNMLEEVELYVYDKYIKELIVEENGIKKIFKEDLEKLKLSPHSKNFIMYLINKQKIKVTKADRSAYVGDNNYENIQEYSLNNDKNFEDYSMLDEYLETRFIPNYVILKQRKTANGEIEQFPSIRLFHIMALKLSEAELDHVMNYLKEKNIRVSGNISTLDKEFNNCDYANIYKESALTLSASSDVILQKIELYKKNNDPKLREEIIKDNMRLVPHVACRYAIFTNIDHDELESYGYEGLILALENFEISYGCTFSSYAVAYIRGHILSGIQEILNGKRDNFYHDYVNAKTVIEKDCGVTLAESPDLVEDVIDLLVATGKIKGHAGAREYARMRIISMAIGNVSLNDEETVEELLTSGHLVDTHDYAEEVLNTMSRSTIEQILDTLPFREAEILRLRFGFYDGIPKTLPELGKIFNVTDERIRQIEKKAIQKLRHPSIANKIKAFYFDSETEKYGR